MGLRSAATRLSRKYLQQGLELLFIQHPIAPAWTAAGSWMECCHLANYCRYLQLTCECKSVRHSKAGLPHVQHV